MSRPRVLLAALVLLAPATSAAQYDAPPPPPPEYGYGPPPSPYYRGPRAFRAAPQLRVGAFFPHGTGYAGTNIPGIALEISGWGEGRHFAVEPRLGVRFDVRRDDRMYVEVPLGIGAYWLFGGSISLMLGGGVGAHYHYEWRGNSYTTGTVIPTTITHEQRDSGWGFGLFTRGGVIFGRFSPVRLTVTVEWDVTFMKLNGAHNPNAFVLAVGAML